MPLESVTARHFEIFLTMALSRNMAEAADALGISQAAVSKSLKVLEHETGLSLFRLANGRLTPTAEAERLLPFAQRALDHLDRARRAALELRGGDVGQIVVGVAGPALVSIIPPAIERFRRDWPATRIEIQIDSTLSLLDKVAGNEVDIGVGTPPVQEIDARVVQLCTVRDICETTLVAVLPKEHRLAARTVIRPADLAGETLIGLPDSSATTHLIAAMFQQARVVQAPQIVAANAVGVCSLVQQKLGVGLMNPLMLTQGIFPGVVARPFRPRIVLRTCIYYSRLHPPAPPVAAFIDCIGRAARAVSAQARS
ncbi:LysR family transcriptional regulator [Ferrovibrio sp.]|uniref:LysR family transcriptional regulator n=1 Tax=Ferrovibrio sp. TaxID=1917215 RepID=UPI0035168A03